LAVLTQDRLELIGLMGAPLTIPLKEIVGVRETRWFNGRRLWWKMGLVLERANGPSIALAFQEPIGRRWKALLTPGKRPPEAAPPAAAQQVSQAKNEAETIAKTGGVASAAASVAAASDEKKSNSACVWAARKSWAFLFASVCFLIGAFISGYKALATHPPESNVTIALLNLLAAVGFAVAAYKHRRAARPTAVAMATLAGLGAIGVMVAILSGAIPRPFSTSAPGRAKSWDQARAEAIGIMNSRTSWPATPEILAKAFWRARAAKNYEEMEALWPGSGSWAWPAICQLDTPVNYVFGKAGKEHPAVGESVCVPYASEAYFRSNHAYNLNMLISSFATSQGQRFYIVSGSGGANGMPVQGASSESQDFGPLVERVIRPQSNCCWALNLASGTLVSSTREHPLDFRVGHADSLRTAKVDLYQPLEANTSDTVKALDMRLVSLGPEAWNTPASEVVAQLDKAAAVQVRQSEAFINGSSVYVFSTREGAKGLLQILKDTVPAKIRYKLVLPGEGAGKQSAQTKTVQQPSSTRPLTENTTESFGPVIERVIATPDADDQGFAFFSLQTGKSLKPPFTLSQSVFGSTWAGLAPELQQWIRTNDVDVLLHLDDQRWGLRSLEMDEQPLGPPDQWERVTADSVAAAFRRGYTAYAEKLLGGPFITATDSRDRFNPCTAFRTRRNAMGMWQVAGMSTTPRGVKIRYKLLQTAANVLAPPREVIAEWLRRVKAGTREAWDLTTRSNNVGWGPSFTGLWEYERIRPLHQLGNEEQAMVLSNPFNDNSGQTRIFYAVLRQRAGQWLVDHHTYVSPSEASSLMRGFSLNPGMKFDVLAAELVGEWRAACDSTISMAADGTGTQLRVGSGGPEPGAKPEPFKWEVSGSTLRRHFADRHERLEIIWMDDNALQFHSPNDSGWDAWWRTPQVDRPQPASATNEALRTPEKAAAIQSKSELSFGPVIERVMDFCLVSRICG